MYIGVGSSLTLMKSSVLSPNVLNMSIMFFLGVLFSFYFVIPIWYKLTPLIMLLMAIYVRVFKSSKVDWHIFLFGLLILLAPIVGDLINVIFRDVSSWSNIEKVLRNMLFIYPFAIAVALRRDMSLFFYFALVGLLSITAIFCVAQLNGLYAVESSHFNGLRTGLWWNPIPFSNAVVFVFSACCATYMVVIRSQRIQGWLLHTPIVIALLATFLIVILSGTRGSLLGAGLLTLVLIMILLFDQRIAKKLRISLSFGAFFVIFAASYMMSEHFLLAYAEILDHFKNGPNYTSISIRLSAWSFSVHAFLENPLLGLGVNVINEYKMNLIGQGKYPEYLIGYHAHSDIFDALERSGVLGLLGLFFLYFSPLLVASIFKQKVSDFYPLLLVTLSVFLLGLTDTPLRNNVSTDAFFLSYFLVLAICLRPLEAEEKAK